MTDGNTTMTPASVPMKRRDTRKKDPAPRAAPATFTSNASAR